MSRKTADFRNISAVTAPWATESQANDGFLGFG